MTDTELRTVKDCCPTCAAACEAAGVDGTVLHQPWIGRPLKQLRTGDVVRSFGAGDPIHQLGDVTRVGTSLFVHWRDRADREPLKGAIALAVLR